MNRLFREPLFHFAVIGGLLFVLHAQVGEQPRESEPVRIGAPELAWLEQMWTRQWRRPPSEQERQGLVVELLKEELLARDARELGLDEGDTIVRRRLAQKVEFVIRDTARLEEPSEAELQRFYEEHRGDFALPERVTFEQVVFSSSRRADFEGDAARELARLAAGGTVPAGDASLLPFSLEALDARGIASQFGDDFTNALLRSTDQQWTGPVGSPFGAHLVRIIARVPASQRTFEEARAEILAAWRASSEADAAAKYFDELLARHPVAVDDTTRALVAGIDGAKLEQTSSSVEEAAR
jgi:hypothetical protein